MSDKLAAWNVRGSDFPIAGTISDQLKFLLNYAVLAPSGPNTQPWKFSIKDNEIFMIADFSRSLPSLDPSDRTLYISHGCVLTNLLLAAEYFGFAYDVLCLPDGISGDRTATVQLSKKASSPRFPDLFGEIIRRHTNRKSFEKRAIEGEKLQKLKDCVNRDGFRLDILTSDEDKAGMAELLARAQKMQLGNKAYRMFPALFVIAFIALSVTALAHQPFFEDKEFTADNPGHIKDPIISTAMYATLETPTNVDYYTFNGSKGQSILLSITIPQITGQENFTPTMALMGPGLPPEIYPNRLLNHKTLAR